MVQRWEIENKVLLKITLLSCGRIFVLDSLLSSCLTWVNLKTVVLETSPHFECPINFLEMFMVISWNCTRFNFLRVLLTCYLSILCKAEDSNVGYRMIHQTKLWLFVSNTPMYMQTSCLCMVWNVCGFHLAGIPCFPQTFCVVQLKKISYSPCRMGGGEGSDSKM